ncbi:DEKNAAC101330 [Brettanomyces naardenensis]|uniref:DEKNAAC101330 n=1 Tax=Brettanomyces naardenensis TaxID=13370 RepID=A0A448YHW7_BRENA|nr:DEKNAAC101330 [Brettanomyces naardenensis]
MHTITESPTGSPGDDKNGSSKGLSKKGKNIVIGCVVGLGVPLLAALGAAIWWYRNRKSNPTGRNYVDSNGRDVGIAVDEDSLLGKLKFWKKRKSVGDFHDDDSLDEDFSLGEDTTASNNNTGGGNSQESNGSAGRSFVVDRPKPLRNTTEQNF